MSLSAFLMFAWDKASAKARRRRIPERQMFLLAALGGWPGAILGRKLFRHKSKKVIFRGVDWIAATLHIAVLSWYLFHR
ncbi:MAG: hypothetical protein BGO01_07485 [Armatimonadetes bacterium 55-13]|nr:MAG: hypothetical protein BGO01_07485 [Armatimonadetes bacterium 55-13]